MTPQHRSAMRPMRYQTLPLLGSNQDSPDPEEGWSREMPRASGAYRAFSRDSRTEAPSSTRLIPGQAPHSRDGSHDLSPRESGVSA